VSQIFAAATGTQRLWNQQTVPRPRLAATDGRIVASMMDVPDRTNSLLGSDWPRSASTSRDPSPAEHSTATAQITKTDEFVIEMQGPNHLLHFILTLITVGIWAPVWIVVAIASPKRPVLVVEATKDIQAI